MKLHQTVVALGILSVLACSPNQAKEQSPMSSSEATAQPITIETIWNLKSREYPVFLSALQQLEASWDDGLVAPLIEVAPTVSAQWKHELTQKVRELTKTEFRSTNELYSWYWNQDRRPPDWYADFKAEVNDYVDPRFKEYFSSERLGKIDLTEVRWGGVQRDGIPPLDHPRMLGAEEASYLADSDVVFGIINKGDARAYPKRILAWHEMFRDEIGGDSIAGVYCTLCGSMIPYLSKSYTLGTSGYLYRSNKLMYDHKTKSLWSTLEGEPVIGPLVDKGIKLDSIPVVTTTWGEWKKAHPTTSVLSLDTGHKRDYREGVAYRSYFGTDQLMFGVKKTDPRLLNKDQVLVVRVSGEPLAISVEFLGKTPIYQDKIGETKFVVVTSEDGANRVYETSSQSFVSRTGRQLKDESGKTWKLSEAALSGPEGQSLKRLPAHRAFWFGWYAAYPDTRLVK